jgi:hypothetical protein
MVAGEVGVVETTPSSGGNNRTERAKGPRKSLGDDRNLQVAGKFGGLLLKSETRSRFSRTCKSGEVELHTTPAVDDLGTKMHLASLDLKGSTIRFLRDRLGDRAH